MDSSSPVLNFNLYCHPGDPESHPRFGIRLFTNADHPSEPAFREVFGTPILGPFTLSILIMFIAFLVAGFFVNRTTSGRAIMAIGGNEEAVRLAGINVGGTSRWHISFRERVLRWQRYFWHPVWGFPSRSGWRVRAGCDCGLCDRRSDPGRRWRKCFGNAGRGCDPGADR